MNWVEMALGSQHPSKASPSDLRILASAHSALSSAPKIDESTLSYDTLKIYQNEHFPLLYKNNHSKKNPLRISAI